MSVLLQSGTRPQWCASSKNASCRRRCPTPTGCTAGSGQSRARCGVRAARRASAALPPACRAASAHAHANALAEPVDAARRRAAAVERAAQPMVDGRDAGQVKARDAAVHQVREVGLHRLGREPRPDRRQPLGAPCDHADVRQLALVAAARPREADQRHFDPGFSRGHPCGWRRCAAPGHAAAGPWNRQLGAFAIDHETDRERACRAGTRAA